MSTAILAVGSRWTTDRGERVYVLACDRGVVWARIEGTPREFVEVANFAARTWTRRGTTLTGMPAVQLPAQQQQEMEATT